MLAVGPGIVTMNCFTVLSRFVPDGCYALLSAQAMLHRPRTTTDHRYLVEDCQATLRPILVGDHPRVVMMSASRPNALPHGGMSADALRYRRHQYVQRAIEQAVNDENTSLGPWHTTLLRPLRHFLQACAARQARTANR